MPCNDRPCYVCGFHKWPINDKGAAIPTDKFYCKSSIGTDTPPEVYDTASKKCSGYESIDAEFPFASY